MAGRQQYSGTTIVTRVDETSLLGAGSLGKKITVDGTAIELRVGSTLLAGRTAVWCQAHKDNTGYIEISFNSDGSNPFAFISAGMGIELQIDSCQSVSLYAKGSASGQVLYLCEVRK